MDGTVIDVRVFTREGVEKDKRALANEDQELAGVKKDLDDQRRIIEEDLFQRVRELIEGKMADGGPEGFKPGKVTPRKLEALPREQWFEISMRTRKLNDNLERSRERLQQIREEMESRFTEKGPQDHRRRRTGRRRAQDGQGLHGRQAPGAARRQGGRTPRQQGRDLHHRAGGRTCRTWTTARRWTWCSIPWACPRA